MRRLAVAALLSLGLCIIVLGLERWFDHREVATVVEGYFQAVRAGDRAKALSYLAPQQRDVAETAQEPTSGKPVNGPVPAFHCRVHHVELHGQQATAQMWIEKEGFVIQPIVLLVRSETGIWKIAGINRLDTDPVWQDLEADREAAEQDRRMEQGRQDGEQIAAELGRILEGRPGVTVERASIEIPAR